MFLMVLGALGSVYYAQLSAGLQLGVLLQAVPKMSTKEKARLELAAWLGADWLYKKQVFVLLWSWGQAGLFGKKTTGWYFGVYELWIISGTAEFFELWARDTLMYWG